MRERRYANLGHLLPMFHIEQAVEPGVSALPHGWPATRMLPRFGHFGYTPVGHDLSQFVGWYWQVLAELHRLDVLRSGAFRTLANRVRHLLAFPQFLETDALDAR